MNTHFPVILHISLSGTILYIIFLYLFNFFQNILKGEASLVSLYHNLIFGGRIINICFIMRLHTLHMYFIYSFVDMKRKRKMKKQTGRLRYIN